MGKQLQRRSTRPQYAPLRAVTRRSSVGIRFVDIHCHCLPGLDDGPETLEQAAALCQALVLDGITDVIATPHQMGRYEGSNNADTIRHAVSNLNRCLMDREIPLLILPGADVRVDERLHRMLDSDKVLTLADAGRYILLELPHDTFIDISKLLETLLSRGIRAVISHPERNSFIARHPEVVRPWLQKEAILQITAGSMAGDFGPIAEKTGWYYLSSGAPAVVATDAHNLFDRKPKMFDAYCRIKRQLGKSVAHQVCIDNPVCVRQGRDVVSPAGHTGREVAK